MSEPQHLIARLLSTPDITRVVPRLPPEVLHRLIERCGLEACADIIGLATPRQLQRLLDMDVWRAPAPGADEAFDAERFGEWLEVLLQSGVEAAAERVAAMDITLVVGGLAEHVAVFDGMAVAPFETLDGEHAPGREPHGAQVCSIGGFVVEGRRSTAWEPIVELLAHLADERPALFQRVMRGCVALSNGAREPDGFHNLMGEREQHRSDLAIEREARRDRLGYVAPAQARAFLLASRRIRLDRKRPPQNPVARACLRAMAIDPAADADAPGAATSVTPLDAAAETADAAAVVAVMGLLSEAGFQPRAFLPAGDGGESRLTHFRDFAASHPAAQEELAFLVNAVLAGGGIQGRPFTPQEASDFVMATCNLGLDNWPSAWAGRDLVTAFQVGWALLHRDLCCHAAAALIAVLGTVECLDEDVQWRLQTLRRELRRHLRKGEPWRAAHALDAILILDAPAWAVLRALIAECPALHETLIPSPQRRLRVDPSACTFAASNADIAAARVYLESLAVALT